MHSSTHKRDTKGKKQIALLFFLLGVRRNNFFRGEWGLKVKIVNIFFSFIIKVSYNGWFIKKMLLGYT